MEGYTTQLAVLQGIIEAEARSGGNISIILWRAEQIYRVRLSACSSIGTAWRKVPLELWDKVFRHYLAAIRGSGPVSDPFKRAKADPNKLAMFAPNTLSTVCKAWRSIVTSLSTLWTDITLLPMPVSESDTNRPPLLASADVVPVLTRLHRLTKQSLPWSLTIANGRPPQLLTANSIPFPLFLESQAALRFLACLCICATHHPLNLADMMIPSITSLVVDAGGPGFANIPNLPNLTKATLLNMVADVDSTTHTPWASLTHPFIGNHLNPQHVHTVLRMCPIL
ncbi:hypothetical protein FA13DRAFT_1722918 [Coprinellus micaceus]|nr:hypothetical protein FA13DRAFT_1722918 [Coprinellus micaceus]